ncbi:MAG: hypothetical protein JXB88_13420 [Spirochaetales bacterium]|nr:hypothetical protein [Spirochaetales bacterium]
MSNYYEYKAESGDGWISIARKFYNCTELNFLYILAKENDKYLYDRDLDGYDRLGPVKKNEIIKLPLFIQYCNKYDRREEYEGTDLYVTRIEQIRNRYPVEICYAEFDDEKPLARRFVYCWKRIIPNDIPVTHFNIYFKNNMTGEQKSLFEKYYHLSGCSYIFERYWYGDWGEKLSTEDKKKFYDLFKSVQYPYAWEDHEILMTDDWGQPWRIEEYIKACRDNNLPQLIGSDSFEEIHEENYFTVIRFRNTECPEESRFAYFPTEDYYTYLNRFAFYTPKEIEEIHFIEHYSKFPDDPNYSEVWGNSYLDKREYFSTGEVYAFLFAPLDTIWARDEIVNLLTFPQDISDEERISLESDYLNNLRNNLEIPDIIDHPPTFHSNELWNVDKLITQELAQEITIPLETTGTYSEKAIVIKLKPNFHEYISLLKKYTYDLQKGLEMLSRSKVNLQSLGKVAEEINHFTHLMRHYPNEPDFEANQEKYKEYINSIDRYREEINELIINIKDIEKSEDIKIKSGFHVDYVSGSPFYNVSEQEQETINLIKENRPYEFIPIKDRLLKITGIFDNEEFKQYFNAHIEHIKNKEYGYTSFFSFQHPWLTPFYAVLNSCITVGLFPDESIIEDFYSQYIVPLEDTLELMYYEKDANDFHNTLTKNVLKDILALNVDGQKIFDESETNNVEEITAGGFISNFIQDDTIAKTVKEPPEENVLTRIARYLEYIPPIWNNFPGVDSQLTRLIKVFTFFRWKKIINNFEKTFDALKYCQLAMREYMHSASIFRNVYKAKRFMNKVVPELGEIKSEYVEIIAVAFYKKFWTSKFAKQGVDATIKRIDDINDIIQGRINNLRSKIRSGLQGIGKAPRWINRFATGLQIAVSLYGIYRIFTKDGEFTGNDLLELISYVANGGLAFLGLPINFLLKFFRSFLKFRIISTMRYIRFGVRVLTIIDFVMDLIFASQKYLWAENTGDEFDKWIAIARGAASITGTVWWTYLLLRFGGRALIHGGTKLLIGGSLTVSGVGTLIGVIILVIELITFIIELIVDANKTGTQKTLENLVNLLNNTAKYTAQGYPYIHEDLFNIASKWRIKENEIINSPSFSPYIENKYVRKRRVCHQFDIPLLMNFDRSKYHINKLSFQPLNYRYSVPAMLFRGWSQETIINLHKTGWSEEHKDQDTGEKESEQVVEERIKAIIDFWERRINTNDALLIDYMQEVIKTGGKISESILKMAYGF